MSKIKRVAVISFIILILLTLMGCDSILNENTIPKDSSDRVQRINRPRSINPEIQVSEVDVTLYFKHYLVNYLVPEKRKGPRGKQPIEFVIVEEILKGPMQVDRVAIMPPNVQVMDVTRKGDTVLSI